MIETAQTDRSDAVDRVDEVDEATKVSTRAKTKKRGQALIGFQLHGGLMQFFCITVHGVHGVHRAVSITARISKQQMTRNRIGSIENPRLGVSRRRTRRFPNTIISES